MKKVVLGIRDWVLGVGMFVVILWGLMFGLSDSRPEKKDYRVTVYYTVTGFDAGNETSENEFKANNDTMAITLERHIIIR